MQISALLTDWERLKDLWKDAGEEPSLAQILEDEPDWIDYDSATLENDSLTMNELVAMAFARIRSQLSSEQDRVMGEFIASFSTGIYIDELSGMSMPHDIPNHREFIMATISPERVERLLHLRDQIDVDAATRLVDAVEPPKYEYWTTGEEFKEMIDMWTGVYQRARERKCGVVIDCS